MTSWFLNKIKSLVSSDEIDQHEPNGAIEEDNNVVENSEPDEESGEKGQISQILTSILSTVKLGSDVLRLGISLPCSLYEPLSILQRQSEMLEYSYLLDMGAKCKSSIDRMAFVAAFAVSGYSGTCRYHNNFNPILGETFEYVDSKNGMKFLGEQVSHHPPISATHAENNYWVFYQNSSASTKFLGNAIDINTHGKTHICFRETGDHFYYTNPLTRLHNILIGKMCVEHYGELHITNLLTNDTCKVFFKKCGFFQSVDKRIEGWIKNKEGINVVNLEGKWNESLSGTWLMPTEDSQIDSNQQVWKVYDDNFTKDKFKFTKFALTLNDIEDEDYLPPTDSRLRLDRKLLQQGEVSQATKLKKILEERKRGDKKKREEEEKIWEPSWFKNIPDEEGGSIWVFTGAYWEQRDQKIQCIKNNSDDHSELLDGGKSKNSASDFRSYPVEILLEKNN